MRIIIGLSIILLALAATGIRVNHHLAATAGEMDVKFTHIEQAIKQNNWSKAREQVDSTKKEWEKNKTWWAVVIDHQEIDKIEIALARIKSYIEVKNTGLSLGELAMLRQSVEHIPIKEAVSIENIL
ncbi:hypothetical protein Dtox_1798 [Desulfofarcimen acetoxidans DSM 771]|uniref:DUF4363 family protein n=1 Tax=Desulfofarcimen acetoxidans (strain ATCC 49208 / DSM 771 / KCTC 5769 / VKM B-1644 / 5575) TaxID=485916 RepID=C8VXJ5_DESAS|nr:DUF4363 family protein [Desulfofarcimen acetoxidans]ACV62651.1 hypothetical protein Dtox_1798 [Desulfofarcimen acetoxidans DSM 771]